MPLDLQEFFATQAAWQRGRARFSWPVKIRMAELMREAARELRGARRSGSSEAEDQRAVGGQVRLEREPGGGGGAGELAAGGVAGSPGAGASA